jgi:hypothetical protein
MPNQSPVGVAGLLIVASLLSGCSFWSWPFPRAIENTEGLGAGRIADYVRRGGARSDTLIEEALSAFISRSIPEGRFTREDAEALGLRCAPAPSTDCSYLGEFWFRLEGVSPRFPAYKRKTIESIEVRLSYLRPREFVVRVRERDVTEE